jgi:putative hydroxymethylpyrimidine transporter CytX
MASEKTSTWSNGLLWFGAAISIAEILTGTYFAPLGFTGGIAAILTGHIIGCALLYLAGLIGAKTGRTAMESVRISFGSKGSYIFSIFNVLQLVGWTAVMIISGARAMGVLANSGLHLQGELLWCLLIGALIILWIAVGLKNLGKVNNLAVGGLFALTIVLSAVVFRSGAGVGAGGGMSFGAAVELSAAMPLSWLPLISDYTKHAKKPRAATVSSAVFYFAGSCWMYVIGLGAAIYTGNSDIAQVMSIAGLGVVGVLIVLLSTVTTTFLDAYSAGVSITNITGKANEKWVAIAICIAGTLIAIFTPIEQYVNFLYLIGSVFAPMVAILIVDFFILKKDHANQAFNLTNLILWGAGFAIYRLFLSVDTPLGSTLPVMGIVGVLCLIVEGGKKLCLKKS